MKKKIEINIEIPVAKKKGLSKDVKESILAELQGTKIREIVTQNMKPIGSILPADVECECQEKQTKEV